jgi:putative spermidine/putrescine transport system permease protein
MKPLLWVVFVGVLIFLLAPLLVVIPVSLSPKTIPEFPPSGVSLQWYKDFFGDKQWLDAAWLSFRLAATVAAFSTLLAVVAGFALVRFVVRGKALMRALILSPLIVPTIITAVALFDILSHLRLRGTFLGLALGQTVIAFPYGVIIVENALRQFDVTLEEAAITLGASPLVTFRRITLPLIAPSVFASIVIGFVVSWDEVVVALFVSGPTHQTLPVRMFDFIQTQIRPTLAAISTLLVLAVVTVIVLDQLVGFFRRSRAAVRVR